MATAAKERAAEFRVRASNNGKRQLAVWISERAFSNLEEIVKETGSNRTAVLNTILEQPRCKPSRPPALPPPPRYVAIIEELEQMRRDAVLRLVDDPMHFAPHLPPVAAPFALFRELYSELPPNAANPFPLGPFRLVTKKYDATLAELQREATIRVEYFAMVAVPMFDDYRFSGFGIELHGRCEAGIPARTIREAVMAYFCMLDVAAHPDLNIDPDTLHNHLCELVRMDGQQMRHHLDTSHQRDKSCPSQP